MKGFWLDGLFTTWNKIIAISSLQGMFAVGRFINDNVMLTHEIINSFKKKKKKKNGIHVN